MYVPKLFLQSTIIIIIIIIIYYYWNMYVYMYQTSSSIDPQLQ
jgi:hypothetical protein